MPLRRVKNTNITGNIPDNLKIGLIVPVCSRKRNYNNVLDTDFFRILVNSFSKTYDNSGKYSYNFYLGYDDDDSFFIDNKEEMKKEFDIIFEEKICFNMIEMIDLQGKVGQIWSKLADIASKDCDYFYQIGDDIEIISNGWENFFISELLKNNNIGVTGPNDINNPRILTQSFVHITHLEIFKDYYPKEIDNWYIDDWITAVYRPSKIRHIMVRNSGGIPRYNVVDDKDNYLRVLYNSRKILSDYILNSSI